MKRRGEDEGEGSKFLYISSLDFMNDLNWKGLVWFTYYEIIEY